MKKYKTLRKLLFWIWIGLIVFACVVGSCGFLFSVLSPGPVEDFFQSLSIPFDYSKIYGGFSLAFLLLMVCLFAVQYILNKIGLP